MSSKTTNYNLTKPDKLDYYDIQTQNDNMDLIDAALKDLNDTKATKVVVNSIKDSVTALESNKANTNHTHDERYYTETEVNDKLATKAEKTHKHTKADISDFPTSMPANGGNADTVDGTHAWQMQTLSNAGDTHGQNHILTCQYTDAEGMFRLKIPNHQTIVNKADYANSAGNADTVDGYHVDKGVNNTYGLRAIAMGTFDLQAGVTVMSVGDIYIMYE